MVEAAGVGGSTQSNEEAAGAATIVGGTPGAPAALPAPETVYADPSSVPVEGDDTAAAFGIHEAANDNAPVPEMQATNATSSAQPRDRKLAPRLISVSHPASNFRDPAVQNS